MTALLALDSVTFRYRRAPEPALRDAVKLKSGDGVSPHAAFDAEVEMLEVLREQGYPDATVLVTVVPVPDTPERQDLVARVTPGPHTTFEFAGDAHPKALRRAITSLYRTDYYEEASLEEMRRATVRALRSMGYLSPDARVEAASGVTGDRTVTVIASGGKQVDLKQVEIVGLAREEAAVVAFLFSASEMLESWTMERARRSIGDLMGGVPKTARIQIPDGHITEMPVEGVAVGDLMVVRPGEKLALDGLIEAGASTLDEATFITEIVRRTGCGLLLDVNNAHVSGVNHRRNPQAYIAALPLSEVGEIHLAGFDWDRDAAGAPLLIDTHGAAIAAAVWDLYAFALERLGPTPTLIERDNDIPPLPVLLAEARCAERWIGYARRDRLEASA